MARTPSPQQRAAYKWVREGSGNLILVAVAGAGKTTTVLNMSTMMGGTVAYCAYNKSIAEETRAKLKAANQPSTIQAGTFHSFGRRNWAKTAPKAILEPKKVQNLMNKYKVPEELNEFVGDCVSLAKQRAFGVLTEMENWQEWRRIIDHYEVAESLPAESMAREGQRDQIIEDGIGHSIIVLEASIAQDYDVIDYDDMIYAPLVHSCRVWENDWLIVDEAQDTNPARRALAKKMLRPGGRAVFVGDPAQAIYGFTGADNDSLDLIRNEFGCQELPLTVTYRCPKAVVAMARQWVKHITAHDSAPEGAVTTITGEQFHKVGADQLTSDGVMLCRTTAPLVSMAYSLIRRKIPCYVEGKEIGRGLLNLLGKWKTNDLDELETKMEAYLAKETGKLLAKGEEKKAEAITERVECIRTIIGSLPAESSVQDLKDEITKLFGDTPEGTRPNVFTLSTVHKSKGREWSTVYLLDREKLMPSRFARQSWQLQQERNLIYVAVTRCKSLLIEVKT